KALRKKEDDLIDDLQRDDDDKEFNDFLGRVTDLVRFPLSFYPAHVALYHLTYAPALSDKEMRERFVIQQDPFSGQASADLDAPCDSETTVLLDRTNRPIYELNDRLGGVFGPVGQTVSAELEWRLKQYAAFFFDNVRGTLGRFIVLPTLPSATEWFRNAEP